MSPREYQNIYSAFIKQFGKKYDAARILVLTQSRLIVMDIDKPYNVHARYEVRNTDGLITFKEVEEWQTEKNI